MQPAAIDVRLSRWSLPDDAPIKREPVRDPVLRYPDFDDKFDATTIFADLYETEQAWVWEATGPPALNLATDHAWSAFAEPSGAAVPMERIKRIMVDRVRFVVPPKSTGVRVVIDGVAEARLTPQPARVADFAGSKVVFTLSKDNDLVWIRDWAQYYVRVHGVDTAVIYDNGSTRTSRAGIAEALSGVEGLAAYAVIDWPFRYGPNDHRRPGTLYLAESDYCQRGMFDHAARCLFAQAGFVINADIDELIYAKSGARICDVLADAPTGYIEAPGLWVEAVHDGRIANVRHVAFDQRDNSQEFPTICEPKWALVPSKLPADVQWTAHKVEGAEPMVASHDFAFGHFRGINTNWDLHVSGNLAVQRTDRPKDDTPLIRMKALRRAMDIAYPDPDAAWIATLPLAQPDTTVQQNTRAVAHRFDPDSVGETAGPLYWLHQSDLAALEPHRFDEAIMAVRKAYERASPGERYYFAVALVGRAQKAGQIEDAIPLVDAARAEAPVADHADYDALLSWCHAEADTPRAIALIKDAIAAAPDRDAYPLFLADLLKADHPEQALEALHQAARLAESPDKLEKDLASLGRQFSVVGRSVSLNYFWLRALRPPILWATFATVLTRLGDTDGALAAARRAMVARPTNVDRHLRLAQLLRAANAPSRAAEHEATALVLARAQYEIGQHYNAHSHERSMHRAQVTLALIKALLVNDRAAEAAGLIDERLGAVAASPPTIRRLVSWLIQTERLPDAADILTRPEVSAVTDLGLVRFRLHTLIRLERYEAAAEVALQLGALADVPPNVVFRLSSVLDDPALNRALFATLFNGAELAAGPRLVLRAVTHEVEHGDAATALRWAIRAREALGETSESLCAHGYAMLANGAPDAARAEFARAMALDPELHLAKRGAMLAEKAAS